VDRALLAFLCDAYEEQELEGGDSRVVLHLHPALAPVKVAVLPLQKNKLGDKAREVYSMLARNFMCEYDETGSIGKRYRRQDEIGTPMCVTIDFETLEDGAVTVRDRDSMAQQRLPIEELAAYVSQKIDF
jgi:glycyl-tRNA synthetase